MDWYKTINPVCIKPNCYLYLWKKNMHVIYITRSIFHKFFYTFSFKTYLWLNKNFIYLKFFLCLFFILFCKKQFLFGKYHVFYWQLLSLNPINLNNNQFLILSIVIWIVSNSVDWLCCWILFTIQTINGFLFLVIVAKFFYCIYWLTILGKY